MNRDLWEVGNYVIAFFLFAITALYLRALSKHRERRWREAFERRHPGKCALCAIHRFDVLQGRAGLGSVAPEHYCRRTPRGKQ